MTEEETYGDAAERILRSLGVQATPRAIRVVVDELIDVQRATVEHLAMQQERGGA